MKRALIAMMLLCPLYILAKPVNLQKALQIAENFINTPQIGADGVRRAPAKSARLTKAAKQVTNNQQFYIFENTDGEGYIIVSADDVAQPILGFADKGNTENIPDNMLWWLSEYDREIQWAIAQGIEPDDETLAEWKELSRAPQAKQADVIVAPLIKTEWSQSPWYNNKCPYDSNKQTRCVTGCVATAMAQIMKYWEFPEHGFGSYSYTHSKYGELSADFEHTYYDWTNMPNDLGLLSSSTQINAIATLMYHCGVAVNMNYGPSESVANSWRVTSALQNYFGYSDEARLCSKGEYSLSEWKNKLQLQLLLGRPLYYGGRGSSGGHAFICDGYRSDDYFHFNWGWDEQDGYYSLSALKPSFWFLTTADYTSDQEALLCLYPKTDTTARYVLEMEEEISIRDSIPVGDIWYFMADISNVGKKKYEGYIYASVYNTTLYGTDIYVKNELVLMDSLYVDSLSWLGDFLYFDLDSATLLETGVYKVVMQYRDESGELWPVRSDYYGNLREVVVYNPIELGLTEMFAWRGSHEHWYTGDSIRFITEIRNHESIPFRGDLTVKLVNKEDESIYQFFETGSCANAPIPAYGDSITSVDAVLTVPAGEYDAFILYRNNVEEEWKMVGCAPGFINPGPLTVETPPVIQQYVILAQRKTTANWYYLTSVNAGTEYTPHLEAINSGTNDKTKVQRANLEDKFIWTIEESDSNVLLKNGEEYISYSSGNTAYMSANGKLLTQEVGTPSDLVCYTFIDSGNNKRYLSLNTTNDYFSFYKGTQAQNLLVLEYGENTATYIENTNINKQTANKVIKDGQIFILRGDKTYTVTGQEVK